MENKLEQYEIGLAPEKKSALWSALNAKGYTYEDVFINDINIKKIDDNSFHVSVLKWNTSRSWMVELTATWVEKENRYKISYYRKGKCGEIKERISRGGYTRLK